MTNTVTATSKNAGKPAFSGTTSDTSLHDALPISGTNYTVTVSAQDAYNDAPATSTTTFRTSAQTHTVTAPGTPAVSNITQSSATASWTAASITPGNKN